MKISKILVGIYILIVLSLSATCVYIYNENENPNFKVYVGTPISEDTVNFGPQIKDKKVVNDMILGFMNATTIDKPEITKNLPDSNIKIDDEKEGICYLWVKVWIDKDEVIFTSGDDGEEVEYKKLNGDFREDFIKYISTYKSK